MFCLASLKGLKRIGNVWKSETSGVTKSRFIILMNICPQLVSTNHITQNPDGTELN